MTQLELRSFDALTRSVMPVRVSCCTDFFPLRKTLTLAVAAALLAAGCGTGSGKQVGATDESSDGASDAADSGGRPPAKDRKAGGAGRSKKPARVKNIKGIPIDVWPEVWLKDPLAVAAEKGTVGGAVPAATGDSDPQVAKVDPVKPPADADKPPPAAGGPDWTALISGDVLADESKTIRTSLTEKLANKGRYRTSLDWVCDDTELDLNRAAQLAFNAYIMRGGM
jgi:hypothetical protein